MKFHRGTDFSHYKVPTLWRRIHRRMGIYRISDLEAYLNLLHTDPKERDLLFEDLLVRVTSFFRDPKCFDHLKKNVVSEILRHQNDPGAIRIWVPGCASGEEAYTLAMIFLEALESATVPSEVEVFATDLSEMSISLARRGEFERSIETDVSEQRLQRFFMKTKLGYAVRPELRKCCVFAQHNLITDPPFSRLDLISCRNVFIYLSEVTQRRVIRSFEYALKPRGFLLMGAAESIDLVKSRFLPVAIESRIFQKPSVSTSVDFGGEDACNRLATRDRAVDTEDEWNPVPRQFEGTEGFMSALNQDMLETLVKHLVKCAFLVNENFEVLDTLGGGFVQLQNLARKAGLLSAGSGEGGEPLFQVFDKSTADHFRSCALKVISTGSARSVTKSSGLSTSAVCMDFIPVSDSKGNAPRYFALYSEVVDPQVKRNDEIHELEKNLSDTRRNLQLLLEKEQSSNEELRSASEEILSANEELQSSNEELLVSKEESRRYSDMLERANLELSEKSRELMKLSGDLSNVFHSIQIAILVVNNQLLIRQLSKATEKHFGLNQECIGKHLRDVRQLKFVDLERLVNEVQEDLRTMELEVQDSDGRWFSVTAKPYLSLDNRVEGVIFAFQNVDELRTSRMLLASERDNLKTIIDLSPTPLLVLDSAYRVSAASQSFLSLFSLRSSAVMGSSILDVWGPYWNRQPLSALLEEESFENGRLKRNKLITNEFPVPEGRTLRASVCKLIAREEGMPAFIIAFEDITALTEVNRRAASSLRSAEDANEAKSNFLANMSHEMRTPLTSIIGYSERICLSTESEQDVISGAKSILKNAELLLQLINEILDLAKIEAGKMEIEQIQFELFPFLNELVSSYRAKAELSNISFAADVQGEVPKVLRSAPQRLKQILDNIVGNALKFTRVGSVSLTVRMSAVKDGKAELEFVITDSGCGMSEAQQERLFVPFLQADSSISRRFGGTGLGLVLARRMAESMGGRVTLLASAPDRGSSFAFAVPLNDVSSLQLVSGTVGSPGLSSGLAAKPGSLLLGKNERLKGLKVLLVDDSADNLAILGLMLTSSGAQVECAADGLEGIEKALKMPFNIMLVDVHMPEINGYEVTRRLRLVGYKVPIVAITANAMVGEWEKASEAGCDGYISKPVRCRTLVEKIEQVLGMASG